MDKVKKKFYEAMEDVLLELVLDDYDRKRYRCARFKGLMPFLPISWCRFLWAICSASRCRAD